MRNLLPSHPEATGLPSGAQATEDTASLWHVSMIYSLMPSTVPSSAIRHTRTVQSETPRDRERPQGAHATEVTSRLGSLIT